MRNDENNNKNDENNNKNDKKNKKNKIYDISYNNYLKNNILLFINIYKTNDIINGNNILSVSEYYIDSLF